MIRKHSIFVVLKPFLSLLFLSLVLQQDLSASLIEVANGKAREAAETKEANQLRNQIDDLYKYAASAGGSKRRAPSFCISSFL